MTTDNHWTGAHGRRLTARGGGGSDVGNEDYELGSEFARGTRVTYR